MSIVSSVAWGQAKDAAKKAGLDVGNSTFGQDFTGAINKLIDALEKHDKAEANLVKELDPVRKIATNYKEKCIALENQHYQDKAKKDAAHKMGTFCEHLEQYCLHLLHSLKGT